MLYAVEMRVELPVDMDLQQRAALLAEEKEYSQQLQREGRWPHLWRVVGEYANLSIFDVEDHDQLHQILSGLPLFPHLRIRVRPLATHPSAIAAGSGG